MNAQKFLDALELVPRECIFEWLRKQTSTPESLLEQLHLVIANGEGKLELVEVLIELGADVNGALVLPGYDPNGMISWFKTDELVTENIEEEEEEEEEDEDDEEEGEEEEEEEEDEDDEYNAEHARTPLFRACSWGYFDIACKLLDVGADIDWTTPNYTAESALKNVLRCIPTMHHTAEEEINALYQIARELLRRGARCDLPGPSGDVLGDICWLDLLPDEQSIVAMVGDAIRNGAEVNATVGVGKRTPLCLVANRGDRPALMAFLLAQGAVDSETSYEGRTPLMGCRALIEAAGFRLRGFAGRAIVHTRMQTVRLLLQHGALIDGISEQWWGMKGHYSEGVGGTALHDAYKASNFDVAKQLERAGALPLPDRKGRLPWECRNLTEYGRYMDERWECRKSFVIILRELGLTSGAGAGVGGSGVLLRMLATREVQSNIASYL